MDITVRPISKDENRMFRHRLVRAFGFDLTDDPDDEPRFLEQIALDRTRAAFDGENLVGTLGSFEYDVTVPGGVALPMAATTMVTVQPTHRRRGILRALMLAHLEDARAHDEPLAGLWASESSIYGRFGYGLAADLVEVALDSRAIDFGSGMPATGVQFLEVDDAKDALPPIYDRVRSSRPGMLSRPEGWWKWRTFYDPEKWREGASAKRYVVFDGGDGPDGYAIYRQKEKWDDFPEGQISIVELLAATGEAHDALWRFLANIDLFPKVKYWNQPVDDELHWRVTEPRRVQRKISDSLWVRVLDVERALTARAYPVPGSLRIGVHDSLFPDIEGTYALTIDDDGATCSRTTEEAEIYLDIDALSAIYLGGRQLWSLARAGRVHGTAATIRRADAVFSWDPAPWTTSVF
ncbi:MAG: GNAT family N-acetyltransferase [Acidimicrobiia bacterium]|nr:GNAT family N-acetyltransferase [Acidimicrobiia bacterium]